MLIGMSIRGGGESERGRARERDCEREGEREESVRLGSALSVPS